MGAQDPSWVKGDSNKTIIGETLLGSGFTGQLLASLKYSISGQGTGVYDSFPALGILEEINYLDLFKSDFRPGYRMKIALVTLADNLCWELDRAIVSLLFLLDRSVAFDTINHDILLVCLFGVGLAGTVLV